MGGSISAVRPRLYWRSETVQEALDCVRGHGRRGGSMRVRAVVSANALPVLARRDIRANRHFNYEGGSGLSGRGWARAVEKCASPTDDHVYDIQVQTPWNRRVCNEECQQGATGQGEVGVDGRARYHIWRQSLYGRCDHRHARYDRRFRHGAPCHRRRGKENGLVRPRARVAPPPMTCR